MRREINPDLLVTVAPIKHLSKFSQWLRGIQKELKLTCKEIVLGGFDHSKISYWRNKAKNPHYHQIAHLCQIIVELRPHIRFKDIFKQALDSRVIQRD